MPDDGGAVQGAAAAGEAREVPFRGGGFRPRPSRAVSAATLLGLIAVWEWGACRSGLAEALACAPIISPLVLPAPSEALAALGDLWRSGDLALHLGASLRRLLLGFALGASAGVAVGLMIGLSSLARGALGPVVAAVFPVPKIALLPLFIIWFGIGEASKVGLIAFGVFFPVVIATYGGVDGVDRTLVRMGQSFGLSRRSIVAKIILPGALPAILSGFRIASAIAIILIVAAELIAAEVGIGAYIQIAGSLFATDQLIAGVAVLSALGLTVSALIGWAERRLLRWRQ